MTPTSWDQVTPGYFTEPARKWFGPSWRPRTANPNDKLFMSKTSGRMSKASTDARTTALANGEWWGLGFLGQLSSKPVKIELKKGKKL